MNRGDASSGREMAARLDEIRLARRVAGGEAGAFEPIVRRHGRMLFRMARSILHDDAEAEDCLQAAWLLAFRAVGRFDGRSKLSTWLARIVINEAIRRSHQDARRRTAIPIGSGDHESLQALPSGDPGSERQTLGAEGCRRIHGRIAALPWSYRSVFMLRAVDELSVRETAEALGVAEGTVRTRLFRARGLLREGLSCE